MHFFRTVVILGVIGYSLAAPKPVDWDDVGRKIKEFGNNVRTKFHEAKEKLLPAARNACGFVNRIPQEHQPFTGFPSQRHFSPQHHFHHGSFPEAPGFPSYNPHPFYSIFTNKPHSGFPQHPPFNRPDWGSHPGYFPRRPSWSEPSTTTEIAVNPLDLNPFNTGSNLPSDINPVSTSNSGSDTSNNGFNPVVNPVPTSNSGSDIFNNGVDISGTDLSNNGVDNPVSTSNSGFDLSNNGVDNPVSTSNSGSDLSNNGVDNPVSTSNSGSDLSNNGVDNPVSTSNSGFDLSNTGLDNPVSTSNSGSDLSNNGMDDPMSPSNSGPVLFNPVPTATEIINLDLSPSNNGFNNELPVNPSNSGNIPSLEPEPSNTVGQSETSNSGSSIPASNVGHGGTTIEQDDMNGDDIPPFIPPSDENGFDSDQEEISNGNSNNGFQEQLDNTGNVIPEYRNFVNRYRY